MRMFINVVVDVFNCIVVVDDVEAGPDIAGYAKGGNIARRKIIISVVFYVVNCIVVVVVDDDDEVGPEDVK